MRQLGLILAAVIAVVAVAVLLFGDSDPKLEPEQIEEALVDSGGFVPGARDADDLEASCSLSSGDGIEDRWDCTLEGKEPVPDDIEDEARMGFPDDRGLQIEVAVWVAAGDTSDEFPEGSFAAVQVGGDGLFEGGGAYFNGGCCIDDADLGTPDEFLDD